MSYQLIDKRQERKHYMKQSNCYNFQHITKLLLLVFVSTIIIIIQLIAKDRCKKMDYITTKEAAEKWNISERRVQILCKQNKVSGATSLGWAWAIPKDAVKPEDGRRKLL